MKHQITIQPKGLIFKADENETILDAAAKAGIKMLKSCDNGICEVCRATLVAGLVDTPEGEFNAQHPDVNPMLPCVSKARSEIILEQTKVLAPGEISLQHIAFQIKAVTEQKGEVFKIDLLAPAGKIPDFHAGQYLELLIDGNEYPFTIASAPGNREIELHIGADKDHVTNLEILDFLKANPTVRAKLPRGDVWIKPEQDENNLHDPLVFIVAGTGFSQAKAMIEQQFKHQHSAIYLYWINRDINGFYSELPKQWHEDHKLHFTAMTPESPDCEFYTEQTVQEKIADRFKSISGMKLVICGGPNFVYSVLDGLESKGIKQSQTMSDVYAYMPRPEK